MPEIPYDHGVTAGDVFEVVWEPRSQPRATRVTKGAARILGALLDYGRDPGYGDVSPVMYHVVVRERATERIVHDENWRGDEAGARDSLTRIQNDLSQLDADSFRAEYGI